jgi:hypothetical protein
MLCSIHALFDCCARGLKFNRPLQILSRRSAVNRNHDSVIFFVLNGSGHLLLQNLSDGKDQHIWLRAIYTVDVLCSHEVRILVPDSVFSHVISGLMNRPLLPLITLDFFCTSCIHAYYLCCRSGLGSRHFYSISFSRFTSLILACNLISARNI